MPLRVHSDFIGRKYIPFTLIALEVTLHNYRYFLEFELNTNFCWHLNNFVFTIILYEKSIRVVIELMRKQMHET